MNILQFFNAVFLSFFFPLFAMAAFMWIIRVLRNV